MSQRLVGYGVSQVPTNGMLGGMAYQDPINVTVRKLDVVDSGANGSVIRSRVTTNNGGYLAYEALNSSGTSTFSVNHNGGITLAGNVIFASGQGLDFSATANSSGTMTSELLNDYEEGTWEPRIANDGVAFVGTTYTARSGLYRKIGSLVYVSYDITVNLAGTLTGNASIGNLPFPVASSGDLRNGGGSIGLITGLQQNYVYQSNYPQNNSTYLFIIGRTAASNQTYIVSSSNFFANSIRITGQAWYSV